MTVVVDTNCLLVSIPPKSTHYWLYLAFIERKFDWLISNEVLIEYEEQIAKMYSATAANIVLAVLSVAPNTIFKEPYFKWNLINKDPDDNKFVDLAIAGNADYIVTHDKHFNHLKIIDFPKLNIITLNDFRKIIWPVL